MRSTLPDLNTLDGDALKAILLAPQDTLLFTQEQLLAKEEPLLSRDHEITSPVKPSHQATRAWSSAVAARQMSAARYAALDFVHDAIAAGRSIRVLSVVDAYTRECLALEGDTRFASWRVKPRRSLRRSYDRLWELMNEKHGRHAGTRAMIALIRMGREFGYAKLEGSIAQAIRLGCTDVAAIRHLLMSDGLQHAAATTVEIGALAAYERPLPVMSEYNQLLAAEVSE